MEKLGVDFQFIQFIQWGFYALLSGVALYAVKVLSKLEDSVEQLNVNFASMLEKDKTHERDISRHDAEFIRIDDRLRKLEGKS